MEVLFIIFIVFMALNFIADIVYVVTKNKYIKVTEQQNELLWALLKESSEISKELIKENLKKDGGQINE